MSVLIKSMKMPGRCYGCKFADSFHGLCIACGNHIAADWQTQKSQQHRPKWCPLVEVKEPHGRLIDADEAKEKLCSSLTIFGEIPHNDAMWDIDNTPTIIDAEGITAIPWLLAQLPFDTFRKAVREGIMNCNLEIDDFSLALQWAVGRIAAERGTSCTVTKEDIDNVLPEQFKHFAENRGK